MENQTETKVMLELCPYQDPSNALLGDTGP